VRQWKVQKQNTRV